MPPAFNPPKYLRDGWYFSREGAGRVHIVKRDLSQTPAPILAEITLSPEDWAAIIATLSHAGESDESFTDAQFVHMGHFRTPIIAQQFNEESERGVPVPVSIVKSDSPK